MTRIAIIGGGLSGLTVATLLKNIADVHIFEKARGVSGRMSTRRADSYFFDHGAQYFTARAQPFQKFIQPLLAQGVIERWNARYTRFDGYQQIAACNKNVSDDVEPRYVGVPGMNAVAKYLSMNLNISLNTRVTHLKQQDDWQVYGEENKFLGTFDWVISTVPAPQAINLLPTAFRYSSIVESVKMRACFSLMLGFSTPLDLQFDAAHVANADLGWIAVNSHKPGRAITPYTLMVHSSAKYAQAHINEARAQVMAHLCAETSRTIGYDVSAADYKTVHGWLYADNVAKKALPVLVDDDLCVAACGDWCLGGRVEGAFMSAYTLVESLREKLL